ncbi:MAG: hypothetical protein HN742_15590 [Lentisphaerae bacterium]|nr:hypothetical protein [Lentisphaerota bacterium]MBT4822739.1 hypothetical protein [Lentisphaerota bacterium]MBT5606238.1 hypothetical protein [Lentisphaerota bacterium]MBT7054309.1 hypothetical protein [Lentisphaerota bacterium]MBT7843300.1 hypothetical protein [Lentisphaerota bacterium]
MLHGLFLGALLMFAPVREIVFKRAALKEAEVITRGDELEMVIEQIRDRTVEKLSARVILLKAGQERMARNFEIINEHFQPFVEQQRATARGRMEKHIADVVPRQAELNQLLEQAVSGGDPQAPVTFAHQWLSRILTGQEEIRRGMRLLEFGGPELLAKQEVAEDAQFEATQFLRWLGDDLRAIAGSEARLNKYKAELLVAKTKVPEAETAVAEAKAGVTAAEGRYTEAKQQWDAERKSNDKERIKAAKASLDEAKRHVNDGRRSVSTLERTLTRAKSTVTRAEQEIAKTRDRLKQRKEKRSTHLTVGCNVHRGAYQRQKDVVTELKALDAWQATSSKDGKKQTPANTAEEATDVKPSKQ